MKSLNLALLMKPCGIEKDLNALSSSSCTEFNNSYLKETLFNQDISYDIRKEIESKYQNSKSNKNYIFPRSISTSNVLKIQIKSKPNFSRPLSMQKERKPSIGFQSSKSMLKKVSNSPQSKFRLFSKRSQTPNSLLNPSKSSSKIDQSSSGNLKTPKELLNPLSHNRVMSDFTHNKQSFRNNIALTKDKPIKIANSFLSKYQKIIMSPIKDLKPILKNIKLKSKIM